MEEDIGPRLERNVSAADQQARSAAERPKEYFSVRLTHADTDQQFTDPREAGAAFFKADPSERPSVTHVLGNSARTMARTEIHGRHETGETRYFKSLPDSHAPDAAFREGFLAAMETSLSERLGQFEKEQDGAGLAQRLDAGLKDDLEAFARRRPEAAAALWMEKSDDPAPGSTLQAAVPARQADRNEVAADPGVIAQKQEVIAAGDWVTTDQNVDLRPVAVATERGIHTGFEAKLPGGEQDIALSDRTFASGGEALRHAWDLYQSSEEGLARAVSRASELERDVTDDDDRPPTGLVLEHRDQPEFPRPETAIYAGNEAQLVLTLGRDTEASRDLAERLVADPAFRQVVAEHVPDAAASLGTGRFVDGDGSRGFLPTELLTVTAYGRDGGAEVLAKFPDEGPLSEALARHLVENPVIAEHVEAEQLRRDVTADPARALSSWVAQSSARIDSQPAVRQEELRSELNDIAKDATAALGLDRDTSAHEAPPRSTLYSTVISAASLTVAGEETELQNGTAANLLKSLSLDARNTGIDTEKLQRRLETGARNAREEEAWVKSDLADLAKRHGHDIDTPEGRSAAAERLDRFYERAANLIQTARAAEISRVSDPVVEALDGMAKLHAQQGSVAFRTETQARDFAEEMKDRYGNSVLKDMAQGRTDALAKDVPDASARQAMAAAVVAAAKEHPSLGLNAQELDAAERRMAVHVASKPPEHTRAHARVHASEREF